MNSQRNKEKFKAHVWNWATRLDVKVKSIALRPMKNKWASCSSNGILNFNAELLVIDPKIWDYVIVHELIHFFVPNHGRLWKSLMRIHLGNYEGLDKNLKEIAQKLLVSPAITKGD